MNPKAIKTDRYYVIDHANRCVQEDGYRYRRKAENVAYKIPGAQVLSGEEAKKILVDLKGAGYTFGMQIEDDIKRHARVLTDTALFLADISKARKAMGPNLRRVAQHKLIHEAIAAATAAIAVGETSWARLAETQCRCAEETTQVRIQVSDWKALEGPASDTGIRERELLHFCCVTFLSKEGVQERTARVKQRLVEMSKQASGF